MEERLEFLRSQERSYYGLYMKMCYENTLNDAGNTSECSGAGGAGANNDKLPVVPIVQHLQSGSRQTP